MIRVPGMAKPGMATDAIVEYVDVYPTLAELAGLPAPSYIAGQSLSPQLRDPAQRARDFALSQFSRPFNAGTPETMGYSIRTATQRYTRWVKWPSRETFAEELYDYTLPASAEPRWTAFVERRNLIDDPAGAAARDRLRGVMDQVLRERSVVAPERHASDDTRAKKKKRAP
jgi:iduronate 2-sulfatase